MITAAYAVPAPNGERVCFALPSGFVIPIHPVVAQMPYDVQVDYARTYAAAYDEALDLQGAAAFDCSKMSAALHEAGHLVTGTITGAHMTWGKIWFQRKGMKGWAGFSDGAYPDKTWNYCGPSSTREHILRHVRGVMAGYMAERVFEGDAAREGSSIDERVVALMLVTMAAGKEVHPLKLLARTEQEVGEALARNKNQVSAIARALISAHPLKLTGSKLAGLLKRVAS